MTGVSSVTALVFDRFISDIVYAAALSPFGNLVARTTDGGTEWVTGLPLEAPVTSLFVNPLDGTMLYGGTAGGGVLKSTDSGTTWEASNTGLQNLQIDALLLNPANPSQLLLGVRDRLGRVPAPGGSHPDLLLSPGWRWDGR